MSNAAGLSLIVAREVARVARVAVPATTPGALPAVPAVRQPVDTGSDRVVVMPVPAVQGGREVLRVLAVQCIPRGQGSRQAAPAAVPVAQPDLGDAPDSARRVQVDLALAQAWVERPVPCRLQVEGKRPSHSAPAGRKAVAVSSIRRAKKAQ